MAPGPLRAHITLPGSKSLSARALLLAATASSPSALTGVLKSRDTDLMRTALTTLGTVFTTRKLDGALLVNPAPMPIHVRPSTNPARPLPGGAVARIDCGLAGTVMRFIPPLAALADAPILFDGDAEAYHRPLAPLLDALRSLGSGITYLGQAGFLPFVLTPISYSERIKPASFPSSPRPVDIDASSSSQFLSALILAAPLFPTALALRPNGPVPSLPHVAMTVDCLRKVGCSVEEPDWSAPPGQRTWNVSPGAPVGGASTIEPDLSNAGPFLAAALVAGGSVSVPHWPTQTTQAGDFWRELLSRMGGTVTAEPDGDASMTLTVTGDTRLRGVDVDLSAHGELAPTVAALAGVASLQGHSSHLRGIAHLRGHETDRLAAIVSQLRRLGIPAREREDGIDIEALEDPHSIASVRGTELRSYADHRMATFAAILGLAIPGITLDDVTCTSKTLPDFPQLWSTMLASQLAPTPTEGGAH